MNIFNSIMNYVTGYMTVFDFVLFVIIFGFIWFGFWSGVIRVIGSIFGIIVGAWLGGMFYLKLADLISPLFLSNANLGLVISFLLIFFIVYKLVGFLFFLLDKVFKFISIIPFLKSINRILGAVLGLVEGSLILGLIFYFYSKYPFWNFFNNLITSSQLVPWFLKIVKVLLPLLPEVVKRLETMLNFKFNFTW